LSSEGLDEVKSSTGGLDKCVIKQGEALK